MLHSIENNNTLIILIFLALCIERIITILNI
jgi:hypothetical protein